MSNPDMLFDGLWPEERLVHWHIPVRCRSGFDGQLPLPEHLVQNSDAVSGITQALLHSQCNVVVVVGSAGSGKTTAVGWLLRQVTMAEIGVSLNALRCSSRPYRELQKYLSDIPVENNQQWVILDGLDELRGEIPRSLDELLDPIIPRLLNSPTRIVFTIRPEVGRTLLLPPAKEVVGTIEWDGAWAGVRTSAGLRVAILQLQDLRHRDMEMYADRRGLGADFVAHLRTLYDLRELVRRFFLLVKLCDLSAELDPETWKRIRDRNELYLRLLTTWLSSEHQRNPDRLPLLVDDLLAILESLAVHIEKWILPVDGPLGVQLANTLQGISGPELRGSDATIVADALIHANIVTPTGFAHKSMEEYLIARALGRLIQINGINPITESRITDDVIGFLVENRDFRNWLDQSQDRLSELNADYFPYVVKLLHRQGRSIPSLDLHNANLAHLQLPGVRLRNANLRGTDLEGSQLGPADLRGADLSGAILRNVSVWPNRGPDHMFSSAEGPDLVWFLRPSSQRSASEAVLVRIGINSGQIIISHRYDTATESVLSDGRSLYRVPNAVQWTTSEATQWIGEGLVSERWTLLPDATPLSSNIVPGALWNVRADQVALYDDEGEQQSFIHRNGSVRGVVGVHRASEFRRQEVDGFCVVGDSLWVIALHRHFQLSESLPLDQPIHRLLAVGQTRLFFKTLAGWCSWKPDQKVINEHPELNKINRILAVPGGGFALLSASAIDFVDEHCEMPTRVNIDLEPYPLEIVAIRRQNQRAVVFLSRDKQWLQLFDEKLNLEKPDWIHLRADGAVFDGDTLMSNELRAALTGAGARDESRAPAPSFGGLVFPTSNLPEPQFDVLLMTANENEFNAVRLLAEKWLDSPLKPIYLSRTFYDLGVIRGLKVGLVRSEMGSGQPGATATTTIQAIRDVNPSCLIAVGILFGVDENTQDIGQILYSRQLQCYEPQRVGTNEAGALEIVARGDKVTANPRLLDRVRDAASFWNEGATKKKPIPALLLSGDKLVDNKDFRDKQLLLVSPEAEGGEMEGSGIYMAASEYGIPWVVIKAICDYADGKKRENKQQRQIFAADNAARFVFHLLDRGGLDWVRQITNP